MLQSPTDTYPKRPINNGRVICIAAKNHCEKTLRLALKKPNAIQLLLIPTTLYDSEAKLPLQYAFNSLKQIESQFEADRSNYLTHSYLINAYNFIKVLTDKTIEIFKVSCCQKELHPMLLEAANHLLSIRHERFLPTQNNISDIIELFNFSDIMTEKEEDTEAPTSLLETKHILCFSQSAPLTSTSTQASESLKTAKREVDLHYSTKRF